MQALHDMQYTEGTHQIDTLMKTHAGLHNSTFSFHTETQTSQKELKNCVLQYT